MGVKVDAFINALKTINKVMRADNAVGHQWKYYNTKRSQSTFDATRKSGKYYTNCAGGVYFGLKKAKLVTGDQCGWYGTKGGIHWTDANSRQKAKKVFKIINFKGKTVGAAIKDGSLKPGDILTYMNISHTNVYIGNGKSFDAGHAYCNGSGEGAKFVRWIGTTPYQGYRIAQVLRLKDNTVSKKPKWVGQVSYRKPIAVRTSPNVKGELLTDYPSLNPKDLVDVCDETINSLGNKWYYVRIAGKYFGWVYAKRISKI